jgi:uncharacterized delta-60 repeat protein
VIVAVFCAVEIASGAAGDLDTSFGSGGVSLTPVGGGGDAVAAGVVAAPDDTLGLAGRAVQGSATEFFVDRLTVDGAQVAGFNSGAPLLTAIGDGNNAAAQSIARDGAGNFVVAGPALDTGVFKLAVARFTQAGALDAAFGTNGVALVLPTSAPAELGARGLALDSQGRILVAGYTKVSRSQVEVYVARLTSAGALDRTFDPAGTTPGVAITAIGGSSDSRAFALAIDSLDRAVVAGSVTQPSGAVEMFVARYTAAGAPDAGFGTSNGVATIAPGDGGNASAQALTLVGGKPTVAGPASDGGATKVALARLTAGGATDPSFHSTGVELEGIASADTVGGLAVQGDGKLVVAGSAQDGGRQEVLVARFGADGGFDAAFGSGGHVLTQIGGSAVANGVALQSTGKSVVAGSGQPSGSRTTDALAVRYVAAAGSTDTSTQPVVPPPPAPGAPAGGVAGLTGPSLVPVGEPALFTAASPVKVVHYQWDLDGSGQFATNGGTNPKIVHAFVTPGKVTIGLRTTDGLGQTSDVFHQVLVSKPALAQLRWTPSDPKPGQEVHFTLDNIHGPGTQPSYFMWKFAGLKPTATKILLPAVHFAKAHGPSAGAPIAIESKSVNLTLADHFTQKFPKSGVFAAEATVVTTGGPPATTHAQIGVSNVSPKLPGGGKTWDDISCAEQGTLPCPEITVSGEAVATFPTTFSAQTPDKRFCPILGGKVNAIQQVKNLGYPPDFGAEQLGANGGAVAARESPARRARAAGPGCVDLTVYKAPVVQWIFSDGTKIPAAPGTPASPAPQVIEHTFKSPGLHTVSVLAEITKLGKPTGQQVLSSIKVDVLEPFCGTLHLNGIPMTTTAHCFIVMSPPGTVHPQYRAFAGDALDMGGLHVSGVGTADYPDSDPAIVSPFDATISASRVDARMTYGISSANVPQQVSFILKGPLHVPAPVLDKGLGTSASDLLAANPVNAVDIDPQTFNGLKVAGSHVFVFPTGAPALADLVLQLPHVFTGTAEAKLSPLGGGQAQASGVTGDDADFSAALPDTWIGPFQTSNVTIAHRLDSEGGGWFGGGDIGILGLELNAPYLRADANNTSVHCGKGGPSGFSILGDASFDFAGATLKLPSDIPLGPVGLSCIQVSGQSEPFVLQGKVGLGFPVNAHVIGVDACFLLALMNAGQQANGCGQSYTAKVADEYWFHAAGQLSVFGIDLAGAHLDVHGGANLFSVSSGGGIGFDFGVVSLSAQIDGIIIVKPKFEFEFDGSGKACVLFCFSVDSIVSSNGVAACTSLFGFEYNWNTGNADVFGGCDLSQSSVHISSVLPDYGKEFVHGTSAAALGATTQTAVEVPHGQRTISFEVKGEGRAPTVVVTSPGGTRYVDDGSSAAPQGKGDVSILHIDRAAETIVTVHGGPPAGRWTIATLPGSPAITGLATRTGLPPTRIMARVTGRGFKRSLAYTVARVPGQTVEFFEQGRTVARLLGAAHGTLGSVKFPPGYGFGGLRRVFAIVRQNGVPVKKIELTRYTAPKPPRVPRPVGIRAKAGRDRVDLSWRKVRGAKSYLVLVKLSDGRVLKMASASPSVRIPFYMPTLALKASVTAVSADGRKSAASALTRRATPKRRAVIHI